MTSHITNRVRAATTQALNRADMFDEIAAEAECDKAANVARFAAESLRFYARTVTGDIGAYVPADPEPKPSDGPDYHAEHAYWLARQP